MAKKINNLPIGEDYAAEMKSIKRGKKPAKGIKKPAESKKKKNPMDAFMKKRNKK